MITISQLRESSMRYIDSQSIALIYMLKALDEILILDNEILVYFYANLSTHHDYL